MNKYVPGVGNPNAKLFFLGEAPSFEEEFQEQPFVGPAGRIFNDCLSSAEISRANCWVSNVFKYMIIPQQKEGKKIPGYVRAERAGINVQESLKELRAEIDQIKPNVIVPLGATALWALRGTEKIQQWRGSILSAWNYKIVPTYHPAALIHGEEAGNWWWKYIIEFDFRRALEESVFPQINKIPRHLHVCRTSAELYDFIKRAKADGKRKKLAIDIEAIDCIPICIGFAFNKHEGISVPLWNHTPKLRVSDISSTELATIWQMMYNLMIDPQFQIVGQNFKYDQDKITRLGFNVPKLHSDTMLKAYAINPEFSVGLAFNTSIYTREPFYKEEGLAFDYTKQPIEDYLLYNAKDAPVTLEIDDNMDPELDEIGQRPFYENFLMQLHPFYLDIESQGMMVNEPIREELIRKYVTWSEKLKYELWKVTNTHTNVNSHKQVDILIYEILKCPRRKGTGEEVLTALLPIVKKDEQKEAITNVLTQRRVNKTIGTYLQALPDYDGKIKTSYFLCLETGRTSTGMLEPPIRPRYDLRDEDNKLKKRYIGCAFQTITKHGDIGGDVRKMYVPKKGNVFINIDGSQAEARVIALLANDEKMLAMYDTNDIHALTASWFFGGSENDYSKKVLGYECPTRFVGKTLRHAGHLGAKKKRAALEVNTSARKYNINISITEAFADIALRTFHQKCPNIQQVFHKETIGCIERDRILIAPLPYGIDAKEGGRRTFYERYGDELFRQAFSYLPQRSITDHTKAAGIRIKRLIPQIIVVLESHDALLFEVPERHAEEWSEIGKFEMERPISFENCSLPRRNLVIPGDIEFGYNYKDLGKWANVMASRTA